MKSGDPHGKLLGEDSLEEAPGNYMACPPHIPHGVGHEASKSTPKSGKTLHPTLSGISAVRNGREKRHGDFMNLGDAFLPIFQKLSQHGTATLATSFPIPNTPWDCHICLQPGGSG